MNQQANEAYGTLKWTKIERPERRKIGFSSPNLTPIRKRAQRFRSGMVMINGGVVRIAYTRQFDADYDVDLVDGRIGASLLILRSLAVFFFLEALSQTGTSAATGEAEIATFGATDHQHGKDCLSKFQKLVLKERSTDLFFDPFPTYATPSSSLGGSLDPTPCPGIRVHWELGSPFLTYPFSLHDVSTPHKLNYTICHIDGANSFITIRSNNCCNTTPTRNFGCPPCQRSVEQLNNMVKQRAEKHYENLQVTSLSITQASTKIKQLEKDLKEDRMRLTWKETSVDGHKDDKATWKKVFELAGTKDIPALHRIFRVGWKYSWSVDKLLEQMESALIGKYVPYSFSQLEFDLAAAVYEIGGGAALYALHKSPFALPCERTVQAHRKSFNLTISSGKVRISDILKNIEVMFKNLRKLDGTPLKRVGITLMMDEIASDGRLCYMPLEDLCVGLCEHGAEKFASTKMGQNLELIEAITLALRAGEIHIGQEILVVAFARNDEVNHAAMPVLILPTCKSGTALTFAVIIEKCRQAWQMSPYGEALHGPLWSIASDGDPKRRPSLYLHCMVKPIASADPLYPHLGELQGLNLMTGLKSETHDMDYKHTFKRICKLLCTREGILVNGTTVNKDLLWHWLEKLEDVDWTENTLHSLLHPNATTSQNIDRLLNPKDPQDVPRAIKLLVLVSELRNLDTSSFTPSELVTHKALSILGEMLHALIEPFINPKLSLAQQITSLVKFAFMACALYIKHEQHFMPHHLYSDLQSMVKTAVFRVAHTLNLDPELVVLLCLLGDDVLEKLFGRTRMIGGHVPNVAVDDLCIRFASCIRLAEIYREHRHWEEVPDRLKLIRNRDFDHLGPRDWSSPATKAVTLAGGKLKVCWDLGMDEAEASLKKYGYAFSFADYFKNWRDGVDLMRPIPGKKYPGISAEVDRSLEDLVKEGTGQASGSVEYDLNARYEFRSWDGKAALAREQAEEAHASTEGHSIWMPIDGKNVHKKTIVRVFMDPTLDLDYNKSTDRLLRVKCYSIGGDKRGKQSSVAYRELPRDQVLELDDLFGTLVSVKDIGVSLAIAKCIGIKTATSRLRSAPLDEISLPDSTYEISGQILSLLPFTSEHAIAGTAQESILWTWNGAFISLDKFDPKAPKKPKNPPAAQPIDSKQNMVLTVNGSLVRPLSASDSTPVPCSLLPGSFLDANATLANRLDRTYVISEEALLRIEGELHKRVTDTQHEEDSDLRGRIPMFGATRAGYIFPYRMERVGAAPLKHATQAIVATAHAKAGPQPCGLCEKQISPQARQTHIGSHILFNLRGIEETCEMKQQVSADYPCGFCGSANSGPGGCTIDIVGGKASSSCKYAYKFIVSIASQCKPSKPCTNVPVKCLCTQVHWKYNMRRHLDERHPGWRTQTDRTMLKLLAAIEITPAEEESLGVPEDKQGIDVRRRPSEREVSRMAPLSILRELPGDSPRRPRLPPPVTRPTDLPQFSIHPPPAHYYPPQPHIQYPPPQQHYHPPDPYHSNTTFAYSAPQPFNCSTDPFYSR
ncbi:hypothetical protein NMY22_g5352 [Coprinellus aureogranulatus]|nr:hypothetical protein NMY22_g5352 [Coprinellus aureogranulatus]